MKIQLELSLQLVCKMKINQVLVYGRTARNSTLSEALVFHQTLNTPKSNWTRVEELTLALGLGQDAALTARQRENAKLGPGRVTIMAVQVRLAIRRKGESAGASNC